MNKLELNFCCDSFRVAFNSELSPLKYRDAAKRYESFDDWFLYVCPFCASTLYPKLNESKLELEIRGTCTFDDGEVLILEDKEI
jgi:hypothetical protein